MRRQFVFGLAFVVAVVFAGSKGADISIAQDQSKIVPTEHSDQMPSGIIVPAGATLTIDSKEALPEAVDFLVLHDNATLYINPDLVSAEMTIRKGYFGKNSKIISRGKSATGKGSDGSSGPSGAECAVGGGGTNGGSGSSGQKGLDIRLHIGIVQFGSLSIDVSGGNGSTGGDGGAGGTGGAARVLSRADVCSGGNGGTGGSGGRGGTGERGGNVYIEWWDADKTSAINSDAPSSSTIEGFQIISSPGTPGLGGREGSAGIAGGGTCRTILFLNICKGSGDAGTSGARGSEGDRNQKGKVELVRKPS